MKLKKLYFMKIGLKNQFFVNTISNLHPKQVHNILYHIIG